MLLNKFSCACRYLGKAANLMIGVPNYETYVQHV